jgi:hypothetical protein
MSAKNEKTGDAFIKDLRASLSRLAEQARDPGVSSSHQKKINIQLQAAATEVLSVLADLDSIKTPISIFDPGNPATISFFVALAMTAQPRLPITELRSFYGAGVYAIYYRGKFAPYRPISGSETPIYVGQAAPQSPTARTAREQGTSLARRLLEHKKNIEKATTTLKISDFDYRALVVQPGWETGSENYLIRLFKPVWNKEIKLAYGIGKHGDSSDTRGNKRSPWDTLHPARQWATTEHKKSVQSIEAELAKHFVENKAFKSFQDILGHFTDALKQQ